MDSEYPPILDAAQVAELLSMNVQMVRKYAREGRIPAYRLPGGRAFKFFRDEIFNFVKQHPVDVEGFSEEEIVQALEETAPGQRLAPITREQGRIKRSAAKISVRRRVLIRRGSPPVRRTFDTAGLSAMYFRPSLTSRVTSSFSSMKRRLRKQ